MTTHAGGLSRSGFGTARPAGAPAKSTVRKANRAAKKAFRAPRVWPALIAALALSVVGVLAAIEIISTRVDRPVNVIPFDRVVDWAADTAWKDAAAIAIGAGLAALGLLCLLLGLIPGHSRMVALRGRDPDMVVGVTRRGLRRCVASAAGDVDGVSHVSKVKVRRRKIKVRAATAHRTDDGLGDRVREAAQSRVDALDPRPAPTVTVRVRHTRT